MDKVKTVLSYKNFMTEMSYAPDCCMVASTCIIMHLKLTCKTQYTKLTTR